MNIWQMTRNVLRHPYDFYNDLQVEGRAKVSHALIIIITAVIIKLLSLSTIGYIFESREAFEISIVIETLFIVVPWITWVISNWGVSTILDGEGKFVEVLVGSAYALVPYTILSLPIALLSNFLSDNDPISFSLLMWLVYIWSGFLFLMQVKILHDFEFSKMISITILSIIGMLVIWFILLLLYGLINQAVSFVFDLYKEIKFRT